MELRSAQNPGPAFKKIKVIWSILDESVRVSRTRGSITFQPSQKRNSAEATAPKSVGSPNEEIVPSAETKAALQTLTTARAKGEERAMQSAREVASTTDMSGADAVAAAQPLRSPPSAKAVVIFQSSLGTSSTEVYQ